MKFGVNLYKFPRYGAQKAKLAEFVRTADALGYHQVRVLDHVVGIVAEKHGGIKQTPYTAASDIHECFALMAWLSAQTTNIRFCTGVLVLPQRQTVLVAKQAAEVDILSGGRITLGVGIGYNPVEFKAMGASFKDRARRFEEQIAVLRLLWTNEVVNYTGAFHDIEDACLAPLPIQRPIPLWIGVGRLIDPIPPDVVLNRIGRLADGWLPMFRATPEARAAIAKVNQAATAAGRKPEDIGLEMNLWVEDKPKAQLLDDIAIARDMGARHLNCVFPITDPDTEIDCIKRFRDVMDAAK